MISKLLEEPMVQQMIVGVVVAFVCAAVSWAWAMHANVKVGAASLKQIGSLVTTVEQKRQTMDTTIARHDERIEQQCEKLDNHGARLDGHDEEFRQLWGRQTN